MKLAALILGLIGALIGLATSFFAGAVGGLGSALEAEGAGTVTGLAAFAFVLVIVGIVGAGLAIAKPKVAGILMLIAGILGFVAVSAFWIPAGAMLTVAGILALFAARKPKAQMPAPPPG